MNNDGKLFAYKLTNLMIDVSAFKQSQCQIYIHYKYAPDGSKLVVLSYFYECLYWYTYEELGKWFVNTIVKRLHLNFLGCLHWFLSIMTSQLKYY